MNDKLKSVLKLIVSLGLGVFLILYFYNQISKPKDFIVNKKIYKDFSTIQKLNIKNNTYTKVGDTILFYNNGIPLLAETEATYQINSQSSTNEKNEIVLGKYTIDIMQIMKKVFGNAIWFWLVISLFASLMSHVLRSLRWRMMLQPLGYNPKAYNTFFAVMIMYMANMAFPRLGELLRCTFITRYEKIPVEKTIGTMLTERLMDMICLLVLGVIMITTQYAIILNYFKSEYLSNPSATNYFTTPKILLGLVAVVIFIALAYFLFKYISSGTSNLIVKIRSIIKGLVDGIISVKNIQNKPLFLFYTVSIWVCYALTIFFCFKAVPETSMNGMGAAITCLFFGSLAIVAVQGGLGIYPIVVSKILLLYGTNESIGYAYGWLSWVIQTVLVLVIGFISMILMANLNKENQEKTT
jgi:uncharacterized protein (TIRG00374 family)